MSTTLATVEAGAFEVQAGMGRAQLMVGFGQWSVDAIAPDPGADEHAAVGAGAIIVVLATVVTMGTCAVNCAQAKGHEEKYGSGGKAGETESSDGDDDGGDSGGDSYHGGPSGDGWWKSSGGGIIGW